MAEENGVNMRELLGNGFDTLAGFAGQWAEQTAAATQNVIGKTLEYTNPVFAATSYEDVIQEFSGVPHAALEVKVSFGPNDVHLVGFLAPAPDAAKLFDVELSAAVLGDEEKLAEVAEALRNTCSEIADVLGVMLFADRPERADIMVGEVLFNRVDESLGIVADLAGDPIATRLDVDLVLPDGATSRLTSVLPVSFLRRLAVALDPAAAGAQPEPDPEPIPITAAPGYGAATASNDGAPAVHPARFTQLTSGDGINGGHTLDLILDVSLRITVELGRNSMSIAEVLALGPGSVVELERQAGEPVDILVNDKLIAHGEVVVVEENFGVRILEIVSPQNRVAAIG